MVQAVHRWWLRLLPLQLIMIMGGIGLAVGLTCAMTVLLLKGQVINVPLPSNAPPPPTLGVVFTPEVQHWAPKILQWSQQYSIDPNMLATVIQIESCGDPLAGSGAGAQGLFQVMPFHFTNGENMQDPDTNAYRGIQYLLGSLERSDGHIGLEPLDAAAVSPGAHLVHHLARLRHRGVAALLNPQVRSAGDIETRGWARRNLSLCRKNCTR